VQVTRKRLVFTAAAIIFWLLLFCPHPQHAAEKLNSDICVLPEGKYIQRYL